MTEDNKSVRVFICYSKQDRKEAEELFDRLKEAGADPWMDKKKLVLGDNWEQEIKSAVAQSDAFLVCLRPGFNDTGFRQREIRWAIEALERRPLGRGFIIPFIVQPCQFSDLPEWCTPIHVGSDLTARTSFEEVLRALEKHQGWRPHLEQAIRGKVSVAEFLYMEQRDREERDLFRTKIADMLEPGPAWAKKISTFLDNLTLALHDLVLEDEKVQLDFYWDTSDIRDALLGPAAFYDKHVFDIERFRGDRALVQCLGSSGWFGTIKMLQPHQAELLKLINRDFGFGAVGPPLGGVNQFIKDVGLRGIKGAGDFDDLAKAPPEEIERLVQMQAGQAVTLFKVVQCVRHHDWQTRLITWMRKGTFTVDAEPYDYGSWIANDFFASAKSAFDRQRPEKSEANFADAVALCQLGQKVQDYNEGRVNTVPRFFAGRMYFEVIADPHLAELFKYRYGNDKFPVFRGTEYYKLRATLRPPSLQDDRYANNTRLLEDARSWIAQIRGQEPVLKNIRIAGESLDSIIERLRNYSFLEQVWLPFAAKVDVSEAVREYVETARSFDGSPDFRQEVASQLRDALYELRDASEQYRTLSNLWTRLELSAGRIAEYNPTGEHLYKNSGLLRFGFPLNSRQATSEILHNLVAKDKETQSAALREFVQQYQAPGKKSGVVAELAVLTGVLWALHMDRQIIDLLKPRHVQHPSLKIVLAAACFRITKSGEQGEDQKGSKLLEELREQYERAAIDRDRIDLAIGLGYLYHLQLECFKRGTMRPSEQKAQSLIKEAVRFAKVARDLETDEEKRIYALNQYLYYMTLNVDAFEPGDLSNAAVQLVSFMPDCHLWQYQYDDTVARYFELMADRTESPSDRAIYLKMALYHLQKAAKDSHYDDDEVTDHLQKLMIKAHPEAGGPP